MFQATIFPSPGGTTVFMRHLVLVILYGWLSCLPDSHPYRISLGGTTVFMRHLVLVILCGWLSGMQEHMPLHTRQSSIQNNKYQVSHKHSCFSWCWAHSRSKHVEERNKHTRKNCAPSWPYLHDYTGMHGQQNIKMLGIHCSSSHKLWQSVISRATDCSLTAPTAYLWGSL